MEGKEGGKERKKEKGRKEERTTSQGFKLSLLACKNFTCTVDEGHDVKLVHVVESTLLVTNCNLRGGGAQLHRYRRREGWLRY